MDQYNMKFESRKTAFPLKMNPTEPVSRTNVGVVIVHNDDIVQDIHVNVQKDISDEYDRDTIIRISKNKNASKIEIEESVNIEKNNNNKKKKKGIIQDKSLNENETSIACSNRDYPTGLHKCMFYKK